MKRFGPPHSEWRRGPYFRPDWHRKRRFVFWRFAGFILGALLVFLLSMAALAFFLTRLFGGGTPVAMLLWLLGCILAIVFPLLVARMIIRSIRRAITPLAQVMAAADAVADGDYSVRVAEGGSNEFGRLADSFNRMVSELERSDQLRRNLTADVAHELRTPIHIIQGNLEGILDGVYEPTGEQINLLLDETRQLGRLVEDLRTLSLAETGQLPLEREVVDVEELLTDVATSFSGQAEAADVRIQVEIQPQEALPDQSQVSQKQVNQKLLVTGDAGRLDQVLSNLIINALHFTPAGGQIWLRAADTPEGVQLQVSDSGSGIPNEDLPFIFDRFWHDSARRQAEILPGSGLGLPIARQLVQAHGGQIRVTSLPDQGTTFTILLPHSKND